MGKSAKLIIGIIVLIIVAGGAYALVHKSPNNSNSSNNSASGNSSTNNASNNSSNSSTGTAASGAAVVQTKTDASLGQYLATAANLPLYTYKLDTTNTSNCTGSCLTSWPAYTATSSTSLPANVSTFTRSDNHQQQYTYKGLPLYTFASDSAGNPTGNGVSNFELAKP